VQQAKQHSVRMFISMTLAVHYIEVYIYIEEYNTETK